MIISVPWVLPSVREGESVDIEIDSGAEVSCFPVNIGADTYPLDEMRLRMVGVHHATAGGGKLHELSARILGWKLLRCGVML